MKKSWKQLATVIGIVLFAATSLVYLLEITVQAVENPEIKPAGTFYEDVPAAETSYLGAAQYFHIFANEAFLKTHTNGNIATKHLVGGQNFGTNNYPQKEYYYLQTLDDIAPSSGIGGKLDKLVVGSQVNIGVGDNNTPTLNGIKLDNFTLAEIYQDQGDKAYIDFEAEFAKLATISGELAQKPVEKTYQASDFTDWNNRVIDVSTYTGSSLYIKLAADVLETTTPLTIKGLEKEKGAGNSKNIYITVETNGSKEYQVGSEIKLVYTDGTERSNGENIEFSDSTLFWNFTANGEPYGGKINLGNAWQGTILAPKATLEGGSNIDGSIIVDKFLGAGETHRWDWVELGGVTLTKVDASEAAKTLPGAEFSLYEANGTLIAEKLVTGEDGTLTYHNLAVGGYYFVETKAPEGYQLDDTRREFTIQAGETTEVAHVTVTNTPDNPPIEPKGSVELTKVAAGDSAKKLAGAEFSLYEANGTLIAEKLVTGEDGILSYDNLAVGGYYFVETNPPTGYQLDETKYNFTISADSISTPAKIEVFNTPITLSIRGTKIWEDQENEDLLRPETLTILLLQNGNKIKEVEVSKDTNWQYVFNDLPKFDATGKVYEYTVQEKDVPNGYIATFHNWDIINTHLPLKIHLKKIDALSQVPLSGVAFSLTPTDQANDNPPITTNEKGEIFFTQLDSQKNYRLKELAPLTGYHAFEGELYFSYDEKNSQWQVTSKEGTLPNSFLTENNLDGEIQVTLTNTPLTELPKTGGTSQGLMWLSGGLMMIFFSGLLYYRSKY